MAKLYFVRTHVFFGFIHSATHYSTKAKVYNKPFSPYYFLFKVKFEYCNHLYFANFLVEESRGFRELLTYENAPSFNHWQNKDVLLIDWFIHSD
jgi:hypothetical protein